MTHPNHLNFSLIFVGGTPPPHMGSEYKILLIIRPSASVLLLLGWISLLRYLIAPACLLSSESRSLSPVCKCPVHVRYWVRFTPSFCWLSDAVGDWKYNNTIQYNTIQYNTIQYNTIQYNTIQYNTMHIIFQKNLNICQNIDLCIIMFIYTFDRCILIFTLSREHTECSRVLCGVRMPHMGATDQRPLEESVLQLMISS